jgi:RluA family pseudouridine synthase
MSFFIHVPDHILFEDEFILVLNKPAGLMVEPDRNGHPNLLQQVKSYLKSKMTSSEEVYAQHIHRLDRPVSGVILFAKQRAVLKNLSEQFAERRVKKHYQALTSHAPENLQGVLEHWHRKEKKKAVITNEPLEYSEAVKLSYAVTSVQDDLFLWDIELHTGKYHQIRAQLSKINCPILGDLLYSSLVHYKQNEIALHACKLVIQHPVSDLEMVFEKPMFYIKS